MPTVDWIPRGVLLAVFFLLPIWLWSRVVKKAGFSPYWALWALLGLLPYVNVIMLWVFAFLRWPALPRKLRA